MGMSARSLGVFLATLAVMTLGGFLSRVSMLAAFALWAIGGALALRAWLGRVARSERDAQARAARWASEVLAAERGPGPGPSASGRSDPAVAVRAVPAAPPAPRTAPPPGGVADRPAPGPARSPAGGVTARTRALLDRLGFEVRTPGAGAAGSEAQDLLAVNPTPIVGGRLLVRCVAGDADVPQVRDLLGATVHAQALKGVLVAAGFTADARAFARGKALDLVDVRTLDDLAARYGV